MTNTITVYEQWVSAGDRRVCDRCRRLHGHIYREDQGPRPPLHDDCRCWRRFHHVELPPGQPGPAPAPPLDPAWWDLPWYARPGMEIETDIKHWNPLDWWDDLLDPRQRPRRREDDE